MPPSAPLRHGLDDLPSPWLDLPRPKRSLGRVYRPDSGLVSGGTTPPPSFIGKLLAPLGAAAGLVVIFVAVLSVPLATAETLGLSSRETVGWIMALYGISGALTIVLAFRYRQPLLLTGNIFLLIFVASLGAELPWPELVGAAMVAGALVLVIGALGVTEWLARWLPPAIVYGLLAGAVLHFFVDLFTATGEEPLMVGATIAVYLAGRRFLDPRVPALLPALMAGIVLAIATGELGSVPGDVDLMPVFTTPEFSMRAILTVTPLMVVLVTAQANVPSIVLLRKEQFDPPEAVVNIVSGIATTTGSLLGPVGLSLSLPATALCAGADAGDHSRRHWSAYIAGAASLAVGLAAGFATAIAEAIPRSLLVAFVGLAVLGVLMVAMQNITTGPLTIGPLFAFAISQSELEIGGLGPFFWALAGGLAVSLILEKDAWWEWQRDR